MRFIFFISLPLYALDQCTKQAVLRFISPDEPRTVIPDFFNLVNVTNTGAAFGSFRNNNTFFIAISSVALLVVLALLVRRRPRSLARYVTCASTRWHPGKRYRSSSLWARDRFPSFRFAHSIRASLAGV